MEEAPTPPPSWQLVRGKKEKVRFAPTPCKGSCPKGDCHHRGPPTKAAKLETPRVPRNRWQKFEDPAEVYICPIDGEAEGEASPAEVAKQLGFTFQVAGVKKPLLSVDKLVQMGNKVHFGPQTGDNFIEHLKSQTKSESASGCHHQAVVSHGRIDTDG